MKKTLNAFAAIGLLLSGIAAVSATLTEREPSGYVIAGTYNGWSSPDGAYNGW